jgi:hypothetical protein
MEVIRPYLVPITIGLALFTLLQFVMLLGARARLNKMSRMMRTLFAGPEGTDLEAMLKSCLRISEAAQQKGEELDSQLRDLELEVRGCIQHFGLVRYDAYGDVSGQQSFSLALLDADRNGAVVSGLFSRSDSRCYGKAVVSGTPEQSLTNEEQRAYDIALSGDFSGPVESSSSTTGRRRLLQR